LTTKIYIFVTYIILTLKKEHATSSFSGLTKVNVFQSRKHS